MKGLEVCALVGMVIGATLFGWSDADAVLCVKKNKKGAVTKVTIRGTACNGKESVGDPNVLLGLATTTTSPTTTTTLSPFSATGPRFVDSAGNDVGSLTSLTLLGSQALGALRTIDDQAFVFPMTSDGPGLVFDTVFFPVDDFQYGFLHQGTQCVGDRFSGFPLPGGDLIRYVYPSADGKSGHSTAVSTEVSAGTYSRTDFNYECALDTSPTVTCDDAPDPSVVVTPVGAAFPCQVKSAVVSTPPNTQCTCIRCCATFEVEPPAPGDPPLSLYPVQTVDLGLGNLTPPFKVVP